MEFFGVEVKAAAPVKVEPNAGTVLHLSQASLGETKKDKANEPVLLYVNVGGKKFVIGTLSADKCPHISYDLVFEKEVEFSHNWKHGSVYFCGYRADTIESSDDEGMFDSGSESEEEAEEEVPAAVAANGKSDSKADKSKLLADKSKAAKPDSSAKVKAAKLDADSEDDDSDDDSVHEESDEDMVDGDESDDDDDEESSDEEEEDTPKNAKQNKKRPAEPASKSPAPEKKAKLVTPQKSGGDGKKATPHTATPHPSKGGKTNTKADKSKQSPKSGGQVSCKACSKNFNSDGALQSHTKAKHSDAK